MKRCSAKPYDGSDKYIFVSYCHKDKKHIFPIIERLTRDGYRVWYDEGIDPGSEWPEIIAMHLNECAVCIAFISDNYLNSHNCRREVSFALSKKKPFISVIIEPVTMSLGMEMQLSTNQSIFKYTLQSDEEYFEKLYEAKVLSDCLGTPNPAVIISAPEDYDKDKSQARFWLVRAKTNETIELPQGEFKLGRSNIQSDYVISGNSGIGRLHAKIVVKGTQCFVIDNSSMNKTYLNSQELEPQKEYLLENGDSIRLMNEKFTFHQSVFAHVDDSRACAFKKRGE